MLFRSYANYTPKEISEQTDVGLKTVYRYIKNGNLEERRNEIQKEANIKKLKNIDKIKYEKIDIAKAVANCLQIEASLLNELVKNIDKMEINLSSDSMIRNISLLVNDIMLQTGYQDSAKAVEKQYHLVFEEIIERYKIAFSKENYNIAVSIIREVLDKIRIGNEKELNK